MNLGLAIFLIILAALLGAAAGFYGARAYMKNYFQKEPANYPGNGGNDDVTNGAKAVCKEG